MSTLAITAAMEKKAVASESDPQKRLRELDTGLLSRPTQLR